MKRSIFTRAFALASMLALAALAQSSCDENPSDDSSNLRIVAYSGNGQTERAGSMLPEPLVVKVSDILGNAKPGVQVEFSAHGELSAAITPRFAATNADGLASCTFKLGTRVGTQNVWAATAEDSTVLSATAVAVACAEESPVYACDEWPSGNIFIATTSSSLLSGAGSAVVRYNPNNGDIVKVLETTDLIDGISFSSRGELFVSSPNRIRKVNSSTYGLDAYTDFEWSYYRFSMEPNPGGVIAGLAYEAPQMIGCPNTLTALSSGHAFANILWENLAVDPVTRDIYMLTGSSPTNYVLWRGYWDGRATSVQSYEAVANLSVGAAEPRGMCADSSGTIYISFDGNDNYRRIVTVASNGAVDYNFFNFYTYYGSNSQEAGRWGDIAYLQGRLYIVDKRNDRLVVISKHGAWLDEIKDTAFSRPLEDGGHYAICASQAVLCVARVK